MAESPIFCCRSGGRPEHKPPHHSQILDVDLPHLQGVDAVVDRGDDNRPSAQKRGHLERRALNSWVEGKLADEVAGRSEFDEFACLVRGLIGYVHRVIIGREQVAIGGQCQADRSIANTR